MNFQKNNARKDKLQTSCKDATNAKGYWGEGKKSLPEVIQYENPFVNETPVDTDNLEDTRKRGVRTVIYRDNSQEVREMVLRRWQVCLFTEWPAELCDVLHIIPKQYGGSDSIGNVFLGRKDFNRAMDLWMMTILPNGKIQVNPQWMFTPLWDFHLQTIAVLEDHRVALEWHNGFFYLESSTRGRLLKELKEKVDAKRDQQEGLREDRSCNEPSGEDRQTEPDTKQHAGLLFDTISGQTQQVPASSPDAHGRS